MNPDEQKTLVLQVHAALTAIHTQLTAQAPVNLTNLGTAITAIGVIKQRLSGEQVNAGEMAKAMDGAGGGGRTGSAI